jgi:hypothetical protein
MTEFTEEQKEELKKIIRNNQPFHTADTSQQILDAVMAKLTEWGWCQ